MRTIIGRKVANKWGSLQPTNPHLHIMALREGHINKGSPCIVEPCKFVPSLSK